MNLEDKVQLLVVDFKKKFGTNPTRVFLSEAKADKFLGLLVKQGDKLAVGVGNRILFWNSKDEPANKPIPLFTPNVFALIESYGKDKSVSLAAVLNAIIDFEQEKTK